MLQSQCVMPTPTVKTPWAHSFAPVKLVLPEMASIVLVRKAWKKPVVLNSDFGFSLMKIIFERKMMSHSLTIMLSPPARA